MSERLQAGAAVEDITPSGSVFLFGYPHVRRYSAGVHDRLYSSALYLRGGGAEAVFIANDLIYVGKDSAARVRRSVERACGVPPERVMVTATHTHSGPVTVDCLFSAADPVVPKADPAYVRWAEDRMVQAATRAVQSAVPAEAGLVVADARGVGTNRRDPQGPSDLNVPVLLARSAADRRPLAAMLVCCMHPTVLHEDTALISGDFPGLARLHLQRRLLGRGPQSRCIGIGDPKGCPVLHHTGPCGNQSPRHVVRANTLEEADRLGKVLADAVERAVGGMSFVDELRLRCGRCEVELPPRMFPPVAEARRKLKEAQERLEALRRQGAPHARVRTAECDWFGAEETCAIAEAQQAGRVQATRRACTPAEIQVIGVGPWSFVGWPGEVFVDYALAVRARRPGTFVISMANGELQGYIVTPEAAWEGGYEASNSLFDASAGGVLVDATLKLLAGMDGGSKPVAPGLETSAGGQP